MGEIENIAGLQSGCVYAVCFKEHEHKNKMEMLKYLTVHSVRTTTDSGELVKTNFGNRCFSKMRWFGPMPASLSAIDLNKSPWPPRPMSEGQWLAQHGGDFIGP